MATRLYGILTDGLNKPIVNATVALLAKGNTITVLNGSEAVFRTDGEGAYNVTVQAGHYKVIIGPQGLEPYKAGEIIIYSDSPEGSLNGYLINWAPEEVTPDVIKQVQQLVANSEEYALQAGRSAAAANADATDARNSKASAAQSASDALVYKNDAKASEDAAKQAQAGAAGSANTASQAVTTIQGLKSDVEQLKTDTQGIKNSAVTETTALKDAAASSAAQASNSATEAGQQARNAAGSAQSASTDAGRAEVAAGKAEGIIGKSLLKENNLSDLSDINASRQTLLIDSLVQDGVHTFLYSHNRLYRLVMRDDGLIVLQKDPEGTGAWQTLPLSTAAGGTGVASKEAFRQSYNVPTKDESLLSENNLSDLADPTAARGHLGLGSAATLDVGTSGDNVPKLNGANTWSQAQTFSTPLAVESGGTGVNKVEDLWPVVRPFDVFGNVGRRIGLPDGITRNHITMWNSADIPPAGWMNYIEGGWFDGVWRLGGIRGVGEDMAACQLSVYSGQGMNYDYVFNNNGTASAANWVNTSDRRVKKDIVEIADPLTKMRSIRGVSWTMRFKNNPLKGFGFVAQEVQKYFPDAVSVVSKNPVTLEDDTVVEDVMSVDTAGVSAALHHEAILALMDKIEKLEAELAALKQANGS